MRKFLPNGGFIDLPDVPLMKPIEPKKRSRCKKIGDFAEEQPWLAQYLTSGLVQVKDEKGHTKQALKNVPCQAGRVIQYTSQYQELDKAHLERSHERAREMRSADFSHLPTCANVLGSGGFLRTSDFFQTFLCPKCQSLAKRHRNRVINEFSRQHSEKLAKEG